MMWFKRTRIAYLALMISMLTLSVTGVVVASTGQFNPISEKLQLRAESIEARLQAAVDAGGITQEEADSIWDKLNVATTQ
mgnify:CR=1 FL=1